MSIANTAMATDRNSSGIVKVEPGLSNLSVGPPKVQLHIILHMLATLYSKRNDATDASGSQMCSQAEMLQLVQHPHQ